MSTASESRRLAYLRLKSILNILTVCLRVFFFARLGVCAYLYPQHFPPSRDDLCEECGLKEPVSLHWGPAFFMGIFVPDTSGLSSDDR
jgi:hypothetical protein